MIHHFSLIVFLFSFVFLSAQNTMMQPSTDTSNTANIKEKIDGPVISFHNSTYDVGSVLKDSILEYTFGFTNIGNEPLFVSNVRTSCHCTVATYPKEPVLPGESEKIILNLDTKMLGGFNKTVAVYSNAINKYDDTIGSSRFILHIKWFVSENKNETE